MRSFGEIVLGVLILVLSSKVDIESALPILSFSLQSLVIVLLPQVVGLRNALLVVTAYTTLGLAGLEVFSSSPSGLDLLSSAGIGYILGFIPAMLIVGERVASWKILIVRMYVAHLVILTCGCLGLILVRNLSISQSILVGVLPFLLMAFVKSVIGSVITSLASRWGLLGIR